MQETRDRIPCIVCHEPKSEGMMVLDEFICGDCEQEIIQTNVEDKKYPYFVHQLKSIWLGRQTHP